jgi:hypothetical protein
LRGPLRKLNRRRVKRVQVFITNDIPGIEKFYKDGLSKFRMAILGMTYGKEFFK